MFKNNKHIIIISAVVLIILSFLLWWFYRQGKKTVTLQSLPNELPGNPQSNNVTGASNDEIKNIVNALYTDMKGYNIFGHNYQPYQAATLLNDSDIIKLYNAFNSLYQTASGQTLTSWISNEKFTEPNTPGLLVARLKKLNAL